MGAQTADGPDLHPVTAELASGKNFASVTTMLPSGRMQTQTIWVHVQDGMIVMNTETHRVKTRNITRDPRITVLIRDEHDPYRYAEVRGTVTDTATGALAREHVDKLAQKYLGKDYPPENIKSERIMLWMTPIRQTIIDQSRGIAD